MSIVRGINMTLTQGEANAKDEVLMEQRGRNVLKDKYFPFTDVTPNEPLAMKVKRYFQGESDESRINRAQLIGDLYRRMDYPMDDRDNIIVSGIYQKIYDCTGVRLKTSHEVLAQRIYSTGETP